jgi:hypothetical protein
MWDVGIPIFYLLTGEGHSDGVKKLYPKGGGSDIESIEMRM